MAVDVSQLSFAYLPGAPPVLQGMDGGWLDLPTVGSGVGWVGSFIDLIILQALNQITTSSWTVGGG